jgi:membrane protease YdiL (CAAX protease family)
MVESSTNRPRVWRWIAGTLLILFSWTLVGAILTAAVAHLFQLDLKALAGSDLASRAKLSTYPTWRSASAILISFLPLLTTTLIAYRTILNKPAMEIFSETLKLNPRRIGRGALVMSGILIVTSLPDLFLNRSDYTFTFKASQFIPYLAIAAILIPMQTSAEELFYRGWIQQWLDNGRRPIWVVSLANGALFALPHLANPEVNGELFLAVIGYGATGFMFSWVSFRDRSIEISLGAHAANNLLAGLLVTSADSALPSSSIFTTPTVTWGPAAIVSVLIVPIFIWLTRKPADKVTP